MAKSDLTYEKICREIDTLGKFLHEMEEVRDWMKAHNQTSIPTSSPTQIKSGLERIARGVAALKYSTMMHYTDSDTLPDPQEVDDRNLQKKEAATRADSSSSSS